MVHALLAGSIVGGAAWCWVKLIAPWVRAQGLHEELLEIQRELVVPARPSEAEYAQGLANLATAAADFGDEREAREAISVADGGERQRQQSRK